MIHKNNPIKINENNIFENDTLSREDTIKDLSKIIISNTEPFVFSINASWGSGKTTFVKMWQMYLKKQHNVNSIYFSAWEDDFSKEPLISILGELNTYFKNAFPINSIKRSKLKDMLNKSGKVVAKVTPAVIKGATGGLLDLDAGYEAGISALSEGVAKELIEKYSEEKNVLREFKQSIENVLKENDKDKPFIIFIDELDRCRPLYSIELLERIKHVFGINNLTFVLSMDKKQLSESIKSQYGNIDTDNYLRRFIDLEYNLVNSDINKFCDSLYSKFELKKILKLKDIEEFRDNDNFFHLTIFKKLSTLLYLSLRQIEQIFTKLHIIFSTMDKGLSQSYFRVFIFFEILKSYDNKLYYEFIHKKVFPLSLKNMIQEEFFDENTYRDVSLMIETTIDCTLKTDEELDEFIKIKRNELETIQDKSTHEYMRLERYISIISNAVIDDWSNSRLNILIDNVIKRIELTDKFNFETV